MTVTATNVSSGPYTGNGSTTAFPFTFSAASTDEVAVAVNGATISSSLYSVVLTAGGGGTVTFLAAPATGVSVTISSDPDFTQDTAFENNGAFLPATFNSIHDRAAIRDIYLRGLWTSLSATVSALATTVSSIVTAAIAAAEAVVSSHVFVVTSATGQTVSDRTLLAGIASPINGQAAYLSEAGREGMFKFDTSNLSAKVTADTRQALYVAPTSASTGASGAWVRVVQTPLRASWFGAKGDGATDDTVAIQAGVTWLGANGGGTLAFANKTHIIAGALQDTSNSNAQIVLPKINNFEDMIAIRFVGDSPSGDEASAGARLVSTLSSGTGQMIGVKNPHASTGDVHDNVSWIAFYAENMTFVMADNPTNSCLDFSYIPMTSLVRTRVDVNAARSHSGVQPSVAISQPTTTTSYGIKGSLNDLPLWNLYDDVSIVGYYTGLRVGELTGGDNIVFSCCVRAMEYPDNRHPSLLGRVLVLSSKNTIVCSAAGDVEMHIELLNVEHGDTPAWVLPYGTDISDASNRLRGDIGQIHMHDASHPFTITGAENLRLRFDGPRNEIFTGFFDSVRNGCIEAFAATGNAAWSSLSANIAATNEGVVAVWSAANRAIGASEKRIGELAIVTDQATNSGKLYFTLWQLGAALNLFSMNSKGDFSFLFKACHITQALANGDAFGAIGIAGTTVTKTFDRAFTSAPVVQVTPQFDLGSGVRMWVVPSTTGFVVNASASVTGTLSYSVAGNPS